MTTRSIDLTETGLNIDDLLDVYVRTQKENGMDPHMKEVDVIIDNDGKVVRDKFGHYEESHEKKKPCQECAHPCMATTTEETVPWYMRNRMGLFGEDASSELEDDEDDGPYICEYCSEIGFKKEYKPYICDTCTACESCTEFESQDCDGCGYSKYRTGQFYSQVLAKSGDQSYLDEGEQELIDEIQSGDYEDDDEVRNPNLSFTIMNYDHTYEN